MPYCVSGFAYGLFLLLCQCGIFGPTQPRTKVSDEFEFCLEALRLYFIYQERIPVDPYACSTPDSLYKSVHDPYTKYFTPQNLAGLYQELTTKVAGIGIRIDSVSVGYRIKDVFQNSPGQRAGLLTEDTIQQVDSFSLAGVTYDQAIQYLGGQQAIRKKSR